MSNRPARMTNEEIADQLSDIMFALEHRPTLSANECLLSDAVQQAYTNARICETEDEEKDAQGACPECNGASEIQYEDRAAYKPCRTCHGAG